ncbi:hypothetical protein D3C77_748430 [compost metagenome]
MQVVPVNLAATLWDLRGLTFVAKLTRHGGMFAGETVGAGLVVQSPHQRGQLFAFVSALLGQRLQ